MTTPLDIINLALKDAGVLGVGQTALAEDVNDALQRLNWMISQWAKQRWLVYHLIDLPLISTGAQSYSIGPGGDFETSTRPDKIESAFMRQYPGTSTTSPAPGPVVADGSPFVYVADVAGVMTIAGGTVSALYYSSATINPGWTVATSPITLAGGDAVQVVYTVAPTMTFTPSDPVVVPGVIPNTAVDYKIQIIKAREDYNRIVMKGMTTGFSYYLFYDSGYPLGTLWFWPAPQATVYEMHVSVKQPFEEFSSLNEDINLPPEYKAALHYNLADRLRSAYQLPIPLNDKVAGWAKAALNVIRISNTQIPRLIMPRALRNRRGNTYNVYSDNQDND